MVSASAVRSHPLAIMIVPPSNPVNEWARPRGPDGRALLASEMPSPEGEGNAPSPDGGRRGMVPAPDAEKTSLRDDGIGPRFSPGIVVR